MARELNLPVQIRIKHTLHAYLIGNYLDLGPSGIMVPEVESEAIVDEAVNAFYYPQMGKRSWGGIHRVGLDERQTGWNTLPGGCSTDGWQFRLNLSKP